MPSRMATTRRMMVMGVMDGSRSVVDDDTPAVAAVVERQGEDAAGGTTVGGGARQRPVANDQRIVGRQEADVEIAEGEGAHALDVAVALLVLGGDGGEAV